MESKANVSQGQTLAEICADLFSLIIYLRKTREFELPGTLYDKVIERFSAMDDKARKFKIADIDVRDAKYALVALIDETVGWASRLEQEYFGKNVAGEEFFTRLEQIKEAKGRHEALEVYYICLTLGFEGKYFRSPEKLDGYISQIQEVLNLKKSEKFSPNGERPQEDAPRRRGGIPSWLPWAVTGGGLVILVVVVIVLRIRIGGWATSVIRQIQGLLS